MIFELKQTNLAAHLFEGWQETLIWSCLQGVMGKVYVDSLENPTSAAAWLGDFCFLAGEPKKEFLQAVGKAARHPAIVYEGPDMVQSEREILLMVPQNDAWAAMIGECYGNHAKQMIRYAIKKEPDVFDKVRLRNAVKNLPEGYTLKMMDEELFLRCREIAWCQDWVSNYEDYGMYQKYGLGAVILKNGEPVSGASSYSGYKGGIEIEIDTREDYRRMGLAYICGAKLILECLERGWYPSWDAHNKESVAVAEKLGYHFDHEYEAYVVVW